MTLRTRAKIWALICNINAALLFRTHEFYCGIFSGIFLTIGVLLLMWLLTEDK